MELFKLSDSEIDWIEGFYPALKIDKSSIDGEISFKRNYQGVEIEDSYLISIDLKKHQNSILPKVREIGNRLSQFSEESNLPLADLHINPDDSFCLTIPPEEQKFFIDEEFNWQEFFTNALEPFLFQQLFSEI
jgi:hypothetical protein